MSSMIGVGYLTLPSVLKNAGMILGMLIIIACSLVALFGSFQISRAYYLVPTENYPELMEKVAGKKWRSLLTWNLTLYLIFSNTMYIYFSFLKSFSSFGENLPQIPMGHVSPALYIRIDICRSSIPHEFIGHHQDQMGRVYKQLRFFSRSHGSDYLNAQLL